ncbi:hypothetical protein L7D45_22285 [Brucella pseudogrignonensis]|uniref:hypothetical protein n=1 Tax=Brucella pseudogrignonensis TaxID=419475 RepID=UPI00190E2BF7|nr:hypothetical protein [Brucella pseudogrignonensis]MBK0024506.1 hypothetical protein [Ochrobactrum sp. S45]MBK0046492.1 hypothetical protein [Ochrobactrum sp. S46]UKK95405.1 hypothetical protein L7D45_22285 [Brucella pseudogrignonensis]
MTIVSKAFTGETVVVDGRKYLDCEFRQCLLIYRGGELPIFDGSFLDDCDWRFEDAALRTINILQRINYNGGRSLIEALFAVQKHSSNDEAP